MTRDHQNDTKDEDKTKEQLIDELVKLRQTEQKSDARVGYQVAASLEANEVRAIWSRLGAMLTANSITIGAIGLALKTAIETESFWIVPVVISIAMSVFGIILCISWRCITARKHKTCLCYMLFARKLEEEYLSDTVKTLSDTGVWLKDNTIEPHKYIKGWLWPKDREEDSEPLPFEFRQGKSVEVKMDRCGKVRTAEVSQFIIKCFLTLYVGLLILGLSVTFLLLFDP